MATPIERYEKAIVELKAQKEQLLANLNATEGALMLAERFLNEAKAEGEPLPGLSLVE